MMIVVLLQGGASPATPYDVGGATRASAAALTPPTVTVGALTVSGATRPSAAALTPPTVAPAVSGSGSAFGTGLLVLIQGGASAASTGSVIGTTVGPGAVLNVPTVALTVSGATRASAATLTPPTVAPAVAAGGSAAVPAPLFFLAGATAATTATVIGASLASGGVLNAPTVGPLGPLAATGASRASTVLLSAPTVGIGNQLLLPPFPTQTTLYEPSLDLPLTAGPGDGLQDQTIMTGNLGDQTLDWPATVAAMQLR